VTPLRLPYWLLLFLLAGVPTGAILAVETPLGHVPDEADHARRADSLLHGALIGHKETRDGRVVSGVPANAALAAVVTLPERPLDPTPETLTAAMVAQAEAVAWAPEASFTTDGSIGGYMPAFYVPGALAIAGARAVGAGPATAFLAIRLVNLACFAVLGALALGLTRRGAATIACTLLLPMTLSVAASCSQDGLLIACTTLACACLTRAADTARPARSGWFAAAAVCLASVIASKPPYAPLAGLLLLPLPREFGRRLAAAVLVVLPAVAWVALELHDAAVPPWRPPEEAGPFWPGARPAIFSGPDFAAQMQVIAADPSRLIRLPLEALWRDATVLPRQMIGVLDYLCLWLPKALYALWLGALAAAVASDLLAVPRAARWHWANGLWNAALIVASTFAIAWALYIQWTPVGMPWVAGIEGRYFLPFLPVLAIALPRLGWARGSVALALIPAAVAVVDLVWLPRVVAGFYGGG
jgi:hypothetical protein